MLRSSDKSVHFTDHPGQKLFDLSDLSDDVVCHLSRVYRLLAATMVCSVVGCTLQIKHGLMTAVQWPYFIGLFALIIAIHMTNPTLMRHSGMDGGSPSVQGSSPPKSNSLMRIGMVLSFGVLQGVMLGPLINSVLSMDEYGYRIVQSAFLMTSLVFLSLSFGSCLSGRRWFLYAGSALSSALWFLIIVNLLPGVFSNDLMLYGGLVVFLGYVVYDTQVIIARVETFGLSNADYITDALRLYIDFMAIFIRILILLARNQKRNQGGHSGYGGTTKVLRAAAPKVDL